MLTVCDSAAEQVSFSRRQPKEDAREESTLSSNPVLSSPLEDLRIEAIS